MIQRFCLELELSRLAPSQSTVMNFNSFCKLGDKYLAANENGVYTIGECTGAGAGGELITWPGAGIITGDSDLLWGSADGANIEAYFEFPKNNFGSINQKFIRRLYFWYWSEGDLIVTVTADDDSSRSYTETLEARQVSEQHVGKVSGQRMARGAGHTIKVENTGGCDFSIDRIIAIVVQLGKWPRE